MGDLISDLFQTKAIKACEADKPFWLTSGKIGAYFINTEFLYGSEEDSTKLLNFIDEELTECEELPEKIFKQTLEQYNSNSTYRKVIDVLRETITRKY